MENLQSLMDERGIGQIELAKAAGVSQATISRALSRGYIRRSKARSRLEGYLAKTAYKLHKPNKLPLDVTDAIRDVWDKTEAHARELAKVIRSLDGLKPKSLFNQGYGRENSKT